MVKLLKPLMAFASMSLFTNINAMEPAINLDREAAIPTIHVQTSSLSARYIEPADSEDINNIASQSYPEGLPADSVEWAKNLVKRRMGGNFYGGLMVNTLENDPVAVIGFGRMPVLNYDAKHTDIIDTFLGFGVIERLDSGSGQEYAKENFKRVDNFGVGVMLPMIPTQLTLKQKTDVLELGSSVFQFLKNQEQLLPLENTLPHDLIGLFSPQDPLLENFRSIGFNVIEKPGFFGFYDKNRVMVHRVL